jgi:biotin carboxylase
MDSYTMTLVSPAHISACRIQSADPQAEYTTHPAKIAQIYLCNGPGGRFPSHPHSNLTGTVSTQQLCQPRPRRYLYADPA